MKKILFVIVCCCLIFSGCKKTEEKVVDSDFDVYMEMKNELVGQKSFDEEYPYHVRLIYNFLEDKYLYDIIIDNTSAEMYYIKALAYGTENDNQICPNIGIFNNEIYHLKKDFVDKNNYFYKGIKLSGTIKNKQSIKVYIGYYSDKEKTKYIEDFIEVKDETR